MQSQIQSQVRQSQVGQSQIRKVCLNEVTYDLTEEELNEI